MNQNRLTLFDSAALSHGSDAGEDAMDLVDLARTLLRGKWWILLAACIGIALGWYQANVRSVPIYRASATLALEVGQEAFISFDSVVRGLSGDDASVMTELEVLQSRGLVTKLVEELDLTRDPEFNPYLATGEEGFSVRGALNGVLRATGLLPPPEPYAPLSDDLVLEETVNAAMGAISVAQREWSYVLQVNTCAQSPEKAALLANTLADLYIQDRIEVKFDKTRQATEWLSGRVVDLQADVERSAGELKTFLASADLISAEALEALNLRLKDQRDRLSETVASRDRAEARLAALEAARSSGSFDRMAAVADDAALTRIAGAAAAGDAGARAAFDRRFDTVAGAAAGDLARADEQIAILERSLPRLEDEIAEQSRELVRLEQLQRQAAADQLIYEYFLTRLKETSVQEGMQQADARVISPAVAPYAPTSPNESRLLAMGGALGLILGAGGILFRERFVTSVRSAEELEALTGLPVLGQIPRVAGRKRADVVKYLVEKPASAAMEAVRDLRTSLLLSNLDAPPQVIMVTSAIPGEGKTTAAFALANNYAALGKKVLIVEGDVRRRVMSDLFTAPPPARGFLDVLSGECSVADAVERPDGLRFDILFGNDTAANPGDVLTSRQFAAFVKAARESYEVVVFDTPPLLVVSDARVIGQHADAIIFTVLWNKTTRRQITDALRLLTTIGLKVTGLVLQRIDPKGMKRLGYGDRYGSYSEVYGKTYYRN